HVQEHEVRPKLAVQPQRLATRRARLHLDRFVLEHLFQRLADALLVIDDEDAAAHDFPRLVRYRTMPVGWMATSVKEGETRSGTAPVESAPAIRCASCATTGPGNAMPRRVSSWTLKRPIPGRSMLSGPAIRNGSIGLRNPATGPNASRGITRVSSRQYTATVPHEAFKTAVHCVSRDTPHHRIGACSASGPPTR